MNLLVKDKKFYQTFFALTAMLAVQNAIAFSVNLADNLMLGGYSENALAGSALVNQIQFLLQMVVMGVGEGIIVLSSQYWGKKDTDAIRRIESIGMRVSIASALLLWAMMFFFPRFFLGLLTNEPQVIDEGVKFLRIICFTYLFYAMTNTLLATLRSVETVFISFFVSGSTLVINCCLNYLLIYGHLGAPRLGIRGSGIATLTSRTVEFIIMAVYITRIDKKIHTRISDFLHVDRGLFKDFLRVGSPVILSNTMWGIAMAIQTGILGHLGETAIAANSIAATIFQILTVIVYGAASASSILTGKTIGSGNLAAARQNAKTLQILYLGIGLFTGTILFFSKNVILNFYEVSDATRLLAAQLITILSITVIGTAYQVAVLTGIVRGGGDTKFVLINDTIFMWLIVLPSAMLAAFVFHLPPLIVFIFLKSDQILKCFVAVIKVNRGSWIRQLTR